MTKEEIVKALRSSASPYNSLNEAANLIESQAKRIGELERDKARLDWIAKEKPNMLCLCVFDSQGASKPNDYVWEINDFHTDKDLRVAIDKAINQAQKED